MKGKWGARAHFGRSILVVKPGMRLIELGNGVAQEEEENKYICSVTRIPLTAQEKEASWEMENYETKTLHARDF